MLTVITDVQCLRSGTSPRPSTTRPSISRRKERMLILRLPVVSKTFEFPTAVVTTAQRWPAPPIISKAIVNLLGARFVSARVSPSLAIHKSNSDAKLQQSPWTQCSGVPDLRTGPAISPDAIDIRHISPDRGSRSNNISTLCLE